VASPANGDLRTDLTYDGLGRLRKRLEYTWVNNGGSPVGGPLVSGGWQLSSETHYIYDGYRVIQERDGSNNPTVSYTRGTDLSGSMEGAGGIGGLLARSSGYSSSTGNWSTHYFYHADGNGNVTYLADATQALAASYRYDPFGSLISSSGTLAAGNVYRFSSKEVHANSGMYYYGFRFYDPNLQRWINRDPIQENGGFNLYTFLDQDPVGGADAFGLAPRDVRVILRLSREFNKDLNEQGKRLSNGQLNNIVSSAEMLRAKVNEKLGDKQKAKQIDNSRKLGCTEQSIALGAYLCGKDDRLADNWKFFLVSATGGALPEPHKFLMAKSDNPGDPILYLDPWNGNFGKKPPVLWAIHDIIPLN
jgi:RHS repeat-associated protein